VVLLHDNAMRNIAAALIALVAMLLVAQPTEAAMSVRMVMTPAAPQVGAAATLSAQTLATMSQRCVDDPTAGHQPWSEWHTSGGPLDLVARATRDGAESIDVTLRRRAADPTWWDGAIVFPAAGPWVVRMVRPDWSQAGPEAEACGGARITVLVTDRLPATATGGDRAAVLRVVLALVALLGALGACAEFVRRPGPPSPSPGPSPSRRQSC
jgi:hypothetical protein